MRPPPPADLFGYVPPPTVFKPTRSRVRKRRNALDDFRAEMEAALDDFRSDLETELDELRTDMEGLPDDESSNEAGRLLEVFEDCLGKIIDRLAKVIET